MKLIFWQRNARIKSKDLDAIEKSAAHTHRKNIEKIVQSRQNVDTLNAVLKQNNITLQLARAIGHR